MSKLPWFLTVVFALLAGSGWWVALAKGKKQQINKEGRQEIIKEIISQKQMRTDTLIANDSEDKSVLASANGANAIVVQECMENPTVQRKIETEAKAWAEEISNQVLEEYQEEARQKKAEKASEYMNAMEDFFTNSVNVYAEEYGVEPAVSEQLHGIVEGGFVRQRELFRQHNEGEISDREYSKLREETRADGKTAVLELLGEEGAEDFGQILREEGQRAKEEYAEKDPEE